MPARVIVSVSAHHSAKSRRLITDDSDGVPIAGLRAYGEPMERSFGNLLAMGGNYSHLNRPVDGKKIDPQRLAPALRRDLRFGLRWARKAERQYTVLRSLRMVPQANFENRAGDVGSPNIAGNKGRPRTEAHPHRRRGFILHVYHGIVAPIVDFAGVSCANSFMESQLPGLAIHVEAKKREPRGRSDGHSRIE